MQTMTARATYDLWADTYPPVAHNPLMRAEQDVVARHLSSIRATRALDVGTGSGRYLPLLAATGALTTIGADLSLGMLRRNAGRQRVCADAMQLPFASGAFDLINASLIAGDISDLTPWIEELARVLEPGGSLIYSDFHPSWETRGWQRTFRAGDGHEHTLARAPHQIDDHFSALERAGLDIVAASEVRAAIDAASRPRRLGAILGLWSARAVPVAMVFRARKAAS